MRLKTFFQMFVLTLELPSLFIIFSLLAVNLSFENSNFVLLFVNDFLLCGPIADLELQLFVLLLKLIEERQIFLNRSPQIV